MASSSLTPEQIAQAHGKPYPPQEQALGETPSVLPDVPICAVFLFLFICCAAGHMTLFRLNLSRGKKFVLSGMVFGFCFTRIMATSLRIAWSFYPTSVKLGIAAMVFVYAGIILLFIGNLFFTQRIVRAQHPHFGWSKPFSLALPILLAIIIGSILTLIVGVILSFYTLNETTLTRIRDIQLYGETLYAIVSFLPIPVVLISSAMRRHPAIRRTQTVDKFGAGSMRVKIAIVLLSGTFLCLGASWRAATLYLPPESTTSPHPWYFSKACFYLFNFSIEVCVVAFWLGMRIDKRFFIPNGAKGPFSYGSGFTFAGEPGNEKNNLGQRDSMRHLTGSQTTGIGSRVSWGGSRYSMGRESRMSWGGISRDDVRAGLAEDGIEIVPYEAFGQSDPNEAGAEGQNHQTGTAADVGVDGAEAEMGWDPKTGKWALRPVSHLPLVHARSHNSLG